MKIILSPVVLFTAMASLTSLSAQDTTIIIDAGHILHRVSRFLTGACIEDVNHEIYGGIDSQLIFGESFAEPSPQPPLKDFSIFGGKWRRDRH